MADDEAVEAKIEILDERVLADDWGTLKKYTYRRTRFDGSVETATREVYDRGHGAVIMLYNRPNRTIVLTRQFRLPAFVTGYGPTLIETCAGLLDDRDPETAIRQEAEEETGFRVGRVEPLWHVYMSPGSVSERLHFYVADYDDTSRHGLGGGVAEEGEDIQVFEVTLDEALRMIAQGDIVDAKTIMLIQHLALRLSSDERR